jgi:hypothetical protein
MRHRLRLPQVRKEDRSMTIRQQLLLSGAAFAMLVSAAHAQPTEVLDPSKTVPCTIEEIFAKHDVAAQREANALRDLKNQELADPENRADRAKNRLAKGDEESWEGGSTTHRLALDIPTIHNHRESFDIVEPFMAPTHVSIPDGTKQCWVDILFGKTLVPCGVHYRDAIVTILQYRKKTVSLDLPDAVELHRVDVSYDTGTITNRHNRHELNDADANIKRIKRELEDGSKAIVDRNSAAFFAEAGKAIDTVEQSVLGDFDTETKERLAPFVKVRADLDAQHKAARANAGDKAGEVDIAFAKVAVPIDQAEAAVHAKADADRKAITQQFADLRGDVAKSRVSCDKTY